ncbi:MAG: hypothetical protein AB7E51_15130 [Pseudodesulfovibrio sp.]|uniref:hypothetical protein n=1 Tax=Pseudodesulfovibrio sp. TaxID=2035812 RepID=UPI003D100E1A
MASSIDICNLALVAVGEDPIASLSDGSAAATTCQVLYDRSRRSLLESHPWNFARGVATLGVSSEDPVYGFEYCYVIPTDCLRPIELTNTVTRDGKAKQSTFRIVGRRLMTNVESAKLAYTSDEKDPNKYNEKFIEALAYKMAAFLAGKLSGNSDFQKNMLTLYEESLAKAKTMDAGTNRMQEEQTIISVRN